MKAWILLIAVGGLAALAFAAPVAADHEEHDLCAEHPTGEDFGDHVSDHAQAGELDGDMNPGVHHEGDSPCVRA